MPSKGRANRRIENVDKIDSTKRNKPNKGKSANSDRGIKDSVDSLIGANGRGGGQASFDRHVALLGDRRLSPLANTAQRVEVMRQLQQDYGNFYVQRVVERVRQNRAAAVQAKLSVGPAGDRYEREADRVAKQVVNMGDAPAQRQEEEEEEIKKKPLDNAQRQDELNAVEEEEEVRAKLDSPRIGMEGGDVDSEQEQSIERAKGGGQPLPDNLRGSMEGAFGADFSDVRIHSDSNSSALNDSMSARAFTSGNDIFFGSGEYNPGNKSGEETIAHELTHVVQQSGRRLRRKDETNPEGNSQQQTDGNDSEADSTKENDKGLVANNISVDLSAEDDDRLQRWTKTDFFELDENKKIIPPVSSKSRDYIKEKLAGYATNPKDRKKRLPLIVQALQEASWALREDEVSNFGVYAGIVADEYSQIKDTFKAEKVNPKYVQLQELDALANYLNNIGYNIDAPISLQPQGETKFEKAKKLINRASEYIDEDAKEEMLRLVNEQSDNIEMTEDGGVIIHSNDGESSIGISQGGVTFASGSFSFGASKEEVSGQVGDIGGKIGKGGVGVNIGDDSFEASEDKIAFSIGGYNALIEKTDEGKKAKIEFPEIRYPEEGEFGPRLNIPIFAIPGVTANFSLGFGGFIKMQPEIEAVKTVEQKKDYSIEHYNIEGKLKPEGEISVRAGATLEAGYSVLASASAGLYAVASVPMEGTVDIKGEYNTYTQKANDGTFQVDMGLKGKAIASIEGEIVIKALYFFKKAWSVIFGKWDMGSFDIGKSFTWTLEKGEGFRLPKFDLSNLKEIPRVKYKQLTEEEFDELSGEEQMKVPLLTPFAEEETEGDI